MDRHHSRHRKSQVSLPPTVHGSRLSAALQTVTRRGRIRPAISSAVGLLSFVTGGAAVVLTASLLALQL